MRVCIQSRSQVYRSLHSHRILWHGKHVKMINLSGHSLERDGVKTVCRDRTGRSNGRRDLFSDNPRSHATRATFIFSVTLNPRMSSVQRRHDGESTTSGNSDALISIRWQLVDFTGAIRYNYLFRPSPQLYHWRRRPVAMVTDEATSATALAMHVVYCTSSSQYFLSQFIHLSDEASTTSVYNMMALSDVTDAAAVAGNSEWWLRRRCVGRKKLQWKQTLMDNSSASTCRR